MIDELKYFSDIFRIGIFSKCLIECSGHAVILFKGELLENRAPDVLKTHPFCAIHERMVVTRCVVERHDQEIKDCSGQRRLSHASLSEENGMGTLLENGANQLLNLRSAP